MVSFELSEEQQLIQQTARDFAERELRPRAAERDKRELFPADELRKLAGLGLMGVNIPGEHGGSEAGVVAYSLAITELSRGCAATSVTVAVTNMVAEVVAHYGSDELKRTQLPRIVGWQAPLRGLRALRVALRERRRRSAHHGPEGLGRLDPRRQQAVDKPRRPRRRHRRLGAHQPAAGRQGHQRLSRRGRQQGAQRRAA